MDKKLPGKSNITYRIATEDDLAKWYGGRQKYGAKAYMFFKDGEAVGLGGYKIDNGMFILFSEIKEGAIFNKATIFRASKIVKTLIDDLKVPVYAISKNDRLCEVLGGEKIGKEFFKWQN